MYWLLKVPIILIILLMLGWLAIRSLRRRPRENEKTEPASQEALSKKSYQQSAAPKEETVQRKKSVAERIAAEILSGGGTSYFGRVLAKHKEDELEALCQEFPIRTDLTDGFSMDNSLQAATFVARILADYEGHAEEYSFPNPRFNWHSLSEKLVYRIINYAQSFEGRMAPLYKDQIYDLAIQLLQCKPPRNEDALRLLEISAPSTKTDHFFWILACKYNVAQRSKNKTQVGDAIKTANEILSGKIKVPASKLEGVRQLLSDLQKIESVEPSATALEDSDSQITARTGKSPEETKEQSAVSALIAALRNNDPDVHATAAELLGEIGDARAVEPLIAALDDSNFLGKWEAWKALGKFDDARAREAVEAKSGSIAVPFKSGPDDPEAKKRGEERVKKLRDTLTAVCAEFGPKEARQLLGTRSFKELSTLVESKRKRK